MRKITLRCLLLFSLVTLHTNAQEAIVRKHLTSVEYLSPQKVTLNVYVEVTIFNERGRALSDFVVMFDPDTPIKKIGAKLIDSKGKTVKEFKNRDVKEYSIYTESTLFQDFRQKQIEVYYPSFPYTAIFEYTQEYNDYISLPGWFPQENWGVPVEYASYSLTYNNNNRVRYLQNNLDNPVESVPKDGLTTLSWEIKGLKPIYKEPFSPPISQRASFVIVVPECFTYKGIEGCYTSWGSYGKWVSSMVKGQDQLPNELATKIEELTKGLDTNVEKVRAIYKYMQKTTRYVSVQMGIGGFKPASAKEVFQSGWGDCKALVNYTKALLKSVGIDGYYCEIGVEPKGIVYDTFPSPSQTNHVILAVPLRESSDTLWLECTNSHLPFGYLPYSLQNQKVLWTDEKHSSGKIVNTPLSTTSLNKRNRFITIAIDTNGAASGTMETIVTGGEMEWLFPELWLTRAEQQEIVTRKYNTPGFRLASAEFAVEESYATPRATEKIQFTIGNLASRTGSRLFIKTNLFPTIAEAPATTNSRVESVRSPYSFCHIDSIEYEIPEGYEVESLPQAISVTTQYGSIERLFSLPDANTIVCTSTVAINHFNKEPHHYNPFVEFLATITSPNYIILRQHSNH